MTKQELLRLDYDIATKRVIVSDDIRRLVRWALRIWSDIEAGQQPLL